MEPRPFIRISVSALALRFSPPPPPQQRQASSLKQQQQQPPPVSVSTAIHSSSSPCFCQILLPASPPQSAPLPLLSSSTSSASSASASSASSPAGAGAGLGPLDPSLPDAACFYLDESALKALLLHPYTNSSSACLRFLTSSSSSSSSSSPLPLPTLQVLVFSGRQSSSSSSSCFGSSAKLLGKFVLPLSFDWTLSKSLHLHHGWVCIRNPKTHGAELHLSVKVEPDPRYIFQFDGEPELSPQIVQIQGNIRQPIFTCKFTRDRSFRSRTGYVEGFFGSSAWSNDARHEKKERKGWLVLIHDLYGSPVAAASIVTPFVPTSGSQHVTRSNPGAWLIMRAGPEGEDSWRPWGRLEAWKERGCARLGFRFQLMAEGGGVAGVNCGVLVSETLINSRKGGSFVIDTSKFKPETPSSLSPVDSPHSSGDFYFSLGVPAVGGFVMSADVKGGGKSKKKGPVDVQLAMRHVTCIEDAAVFMALSAAVDLSMDACLPFNKKLGKSFYSNQIGG